MTQPSIHEIAKALSDELRVKILTEMSTKPPMRHTDLLNYIGLDAGESNKLSYHLGILMEAELVSKQNLVYTLTEKGREVLEDLSVTINDWEELAYRDDLKTLSGLEAASLLWFDQKYYGGVSWVFVGLLLFFYTRTIFFLLILPLALVWLYISYKYKPSIEFENQKKAILHLKALLGRNRLMPSLILDTGFGGVSLIFLIIFYLDVHQENITAFTLFFLCCLILSIGTSIWLTRQLIKVWDDLKKGKKPVDYKDALLIITNILIQLDIFIGVFIIAGLITNLSGVGAIAGVSGQLFFQAWRLFKETYSDNFSP